jgi:hypothetical protein
MYEGWTRVLIVFLTHMPTVFFIPAPGIFSWARGLLQAGLVLALHAASEGKNSGVVEIAIYGMVGAMLLLLTAKAAIRRK